MKPRDFDYLRTLLKSASGLVLTDDKQYLIESRLLPVAKKLKFETIDAMVDELRRSEATTLKNQIVEAMTINGHSSLEIKRHLIILKTLCCRN